MKLIWTNDGNIGIKFMDSDKVIWCSNRLEASMIAHGNFVKLQDPPTLEMVRKDIDYAIDHMIKTGDTVAEFGIFGSFMYTTTEPEYEF